jgi:hypothetical protein
MRNCVLRTRREPPEGGAKMRWCTCFALFPRFRPSFSMPVAPCTRLVASPATRKCRPNRAVDAHARGGAYGGVLGRHSAKSPTTPNVAETRATPEPHGKETSADFRCFFRRRAFQRGDVGGVMPGENHAHSVIFIFFNLSSLNRLPPDPTSTSSVSDTLSCLLMIFFFVSSLLKYVKNATQNGGGPQKNKTCSMDGRVDIVK